jgi:superfamily II DNA or RNA helicase
VNQVSLFDAEPVTAPPSRPTLVVPSGARPPRPYQLEAADAIEMEWATYRSTLIVMPTASGKTRCATEILARRKHVGRSLFIAQREELIQQAARAISRDADLTTEIEMAQDYAALDSDIFGGRSDVVVASVQSLHERRLKRWPRDAFKTIFIDESHHAISAGHRRVIDWFRDAKLCGLTATADRSDKIGLKAVFESCAYNYEIRTAIQDGWIVPIRMLAVQCADLDISAIKTVRGDLSEGDLEQAMSVDKVLHEIAGPLVREAGARQTIVFTVGVAQAHALAAVMAGYTSARIVSADGETHKTVRREIVDDFRNGKVQFLINCGLWVEGFDAPSCSCIAMARPTKSRALASQCIGRGFRVADGVLNGLDTPEERRAAIAASATPDLLVLDFVGNSGRHQLVNALDVLGGKDIPPEVRKLAGDYAGRGMDLEGAMCAAEREVERRRKLADEMKRARVRADLDYRTQEVNPFSGRSGEAFEILGMKRPTEAADVSQRMTAAQDGLLKKHGVELPKVTARTDASRLIGAMFKRRDRNLCTYKQARILARAGLRTNLYFEDARKAIDALAANKWQSNDEIWEQWGRRDVRS